MTRTVLVTGAAGFLGGRVVQRLAAASDLNIVATDLRVPSEPPPGVEFVALDLRDREGLAALFERTRPDVIVHLASIIAVPPGMTRETVHDIDVGSVRRLLELAESVGSRQLIITSSGAAYGYHADNPVPLREDDALRGNREFPYSDHKREIEEILATWRQANRGPAQLILRPGTVLGPGVDNPITAIFARPIIVTIAGSDSPFVAIDVDDVAEIIRIGVVEERSGIYNVAGDGAVPVADIARLLGKRVVALPAFLLAAALAVLHPLRLAPWGPEQVRFLRWRPVLANDRLRRDFPTLPRRSSLDVLTAFFAARPDLSAGGSQ